MSTIEPSSQGDVISPLIGARILEIMEEKGKAFTRQAIANRIDMNRDTLSKKLLGERKLYRFELRRIAEALNLTVERVLQEDTKEDEVKLQQMLEHPTHSGIVALAQKITAAAVGLTERTNALNNLGRAYFVFQKYEEAHRVWLEAYECSKMLLKKYGDPEMYNMVLSNLLISYTVCKDYARAGEILEEVEAAFADDLGRIGIVYYARAKRAEHENNLIEAKENAYISLEKYRLTGNRRNIGKAEATAAHYEYLTGDYEASKALLEKSRENLEPFLYNWLLSTKDYVKALLKLGEKKSACQSVSDAIARASGAVLSSADIIGKLKILLAVSSGDHVHAENVLSGGQYTEKIRLLACRYLKMRCILNGDKEALMKYVIIESEIGVNSCDLLDGEEL